MHADMLVFVSKDEENPEFFAEALLEPYGSEYEVEEYEDECRCVGEISDQTSIMEADILFGNYTYRKFKFEEQNPGLQHGTEYYAKWSIFNKERDAFVKNLCSRNNHQDHCPNPKCYECLGTGVSFTTSNPDAEWDWYTIGGRYAGSASPTKDKDILPILELADGYVPYGIITPDGDWIDDISAEDFKDYVDCYKDYIGVLVDIHN